MLNLVSLATVIAAASAAGLKGFNYGSTDSSGAYHTQSDFESLFKAAANLEGASGFTSARLYTMIQGGSTADPISAIPAAIATKTKLLLGLWCSAGEETFNNEITALKAAIEQYGSELSDLIVGISVGSEDLYRDSIMGNQANAGIGTTPDTIVSYIKTVRDTISGTSISGASIGHVDTWTAWVNGSNSEVIDNLDWVGFDGYPYFQNTMSNSIDDAKSLFYDSYDKTKAAAGSKEVWITETGWPLSGPDENLAKANVENAKTYWDEVGCELFADGVNTFWYTLFDGTSSPSFGIVGSTLSSTPAFDLSCSAKNTTESSSSASSSAASSTSAVASSSSSVAASSSSAAASSSSAAASSSAAPVSSSSAAAPVTTSEAAPVSSSAAPVTSSAAHTTSAAALPTSAAEEPTTAAATTAAATTVVNSGAYRVLSGQTATLAALVAVIAVFM